jgi:GNAT superfamily N-acetyltransferase
MSRSKHSNGDADRVDVAACDPASAEALAMSDALWDEIQRRYEFAAPSPFDPADFAGPIGGFWVATVDGRPVGSVALTPLEPPAAELDVMYVAPEHRRAGVARALLAAVEDHARTAGVAVLRLRAGEPQPEALRFYRAAGFTPIEPFGKWVGDDTARCFEKRLDAQPRRASLA